MTQTLKITQIGNSLGVILPKEILAKLRVNKGDQLFLCETANGIEVSAYDADFAHQMELAEIIMRKHRDVLALLAK